MDEESNSKLSLVTNRIAARRADRAEEPTAGDVYATVMGQRTASVLKFIRGDGKPFSVYYAMLPIVWGDFLPELILIEYPGLFTVRLKGKGLEPLEAHLSERRVTWIRACTESAAASLDLAVTSIDILRFYPSREINSDGASDIFCPV